MYFRKIWYFEKGMRNIAGILKLNFYFFPDFVSLSVILSLSLLSLLVAL